jgi:hypothetical protein
LQLGITFVNHFLAWSPLLFGVVQVPILFAVGRPLWPFLRKKAPLLLMGRGMPLLITEVALIILVPGAVVLALISSYFGTTSLAFIRPWLSGLGLGFAACVMYYMPKDTKQKSHKWRIGSGLKEPK